MKHLTILFDLALIPLCAFLGSLVPIGAGNGFVLGLFLGIVLLCLILTYGSGRKKTRFSTSYYLNQHHQDNAGTNQEVVDINTARAWDVIARH